MNFDQSSEAKLTGHNISNTNINSRCNLIVNYLPQSLKQEDFTTLFSAIGPIKTCRLMHDRSTGYSYGYGFVEYVKEEDAQTAIEKFNGHQIEHKQLKVALARPNTDDTKNTNLYIKNMPFDYSEQQLADLFSQYGQVIQVKILRDPLTNSSRRSGFVIMATKQMAKIAIQSLDKSILNNSANEPIYVNFATNEDTKKRNSSNQNHNRHHAHFHANQHHQNNNNVYVNQHAQIHPISFPIRQNNQNQALPVMQMMGKMKATRPGINSSRFNPLSGTQLNSQNNGNDNNNNNFITIPSPYSNFGQSNSLPGGNTGFENLINPIGSGVTGNGQNTSVWHPQHQQANYLNASPMTSGVLLDGSNNTKNNNSFNPLNQNSGGASNTIYVYGIGHNATESDLFALFHKCGNIQRVNVIKNAKTGQGKNYGFVVFQSWEEACIAIQTMHGSLYNNQHLQVHFNNGHSDSQINC